MDRFRRWFDFSRFVLALLAIALLALIYVYVLDNSWKDLANRS